MGNRNGQDHLFNKKDRLAEATSGARAMRFNKEAVNKFFYLLEEVLGKHGLTAEKIFNADEAGINEFSHPRLESKMLQQRSAIRIKSIHAIFVSACSVLLLFDGHSTHTKNLDLIGYANDHRVIVLCFSSHCAHCLQPLHKCLL
ncbi:hypothetical protein ILUMI_14484 [Ignelater luminosus]|uniref:DDE-1 domain-containing protein n=1 Tax=Ignelater luminosus TaxID=2038154 RepID=A0A8K0G9Z1_IGNLU|nr:hypothetical protein ILUMI_14484 [Ignelater luminosus]